MAPGPGISFLSPIEFPAIFALLLNLAVSSAPPPEHRERSLDSREAQYSRLEYSTFPLTELFAFALKPSSPARDSSAMGWNKEPAFSSLFFPPYSSFLYASQRQRDARVCRFVPQRDSADLHREQRFV